MTRTPTPGPLSLRAHPHRGSVGIRGAVGALKFRRPSLCERSGSGLADGSADSQQRYCANLGHRQDDETGTYTGGSPDGDGLVYMRARYYVPGTGRFISEAPGRYGANWYLYCSNSPLANSDASGRLSESDIRNILIGILSSALWDIIRSSIPSISAFLTGLATRGAAWGASQAFRYAAMFFTTGAIESEDGLALLEEGSFLGDIGGIASEEAGTAIALAGTQKLVAGFAFKQSGLLLQIIGEEFL